MTAFLDFPAEQFGDEVTFWRAIAGSTVSPPRGAHREFATLEPFNGEPHLRVQRIDDGPGGVHLDLHVDDPRTAAATAADLGATVGQTREDLVVARSPAGMTFCLVAWNGHAERSRPIRWPSDTISIIDQICFDVPDPDFDREVAFWAELVGAEPVGRSRPEFTGLRRDPALSLQILLQRVPAETGSPASAHLDLATTSVDDEVHRHEDWGARVVETHAHWTMMADPVGRLYCITDRNPRTGS